MPVSKYTRPPVGATYGRWAVLSYSHAVFTKGRRAAEHYWLCLCNCGARRPVHARSLVKGTSRSCGCLQREIAAASGRRSATTHGQSRSGEYYSWASMIQRCTNPNRQAFVNYGGRGITICRRWLKFENFLADMGVRPSPTHTLERRRNNEGYYPDNCYWATPKQQSVNKRNNKLISYKGKTQTLSQWAEELEMNYIALSFRFRYKWDVERAFTQPIQPRQRTMLK